MPAMNVFIKQRMIVKRSFSSIADLEKLIVSDTHWNKSMEAKALANHFINHPPSSSLKATDMRDYIAQRSPDKVILSTSPAFRVLSSHLTFPLTLSYGLQQLFCTPENVDKRQSKRVLIVGARGESSLPAVWWRENMFLQGVTHKDIHFTGPGLLVNNSLLYSNPKLLNALLQFVDKDKKRHTFSLTNALSVSHTPSIESAPFGTATPNSAAGTSRWSKENVVDDPPSDTVISHRLPDDVSLLHQHPRLQELLQWADVFVLYNPGYGSKVIKSSWEATMKILLQSKKPVLCTAHGHYDMERDLTTLQSLTNNGTTMKYLINPHENPFKSSKLTIDVKEDDPAKIVTTNYSIYSFVGL